MTDVKPVYQSNACAGLSEAEREELWRAATTLVDSRGVVIRISEVLGGALDRFGGRAASAALGEGWRDKVAQMAEQALRRGYGLATLGLDPDGTRQPWGWFNKLIASASGATGGFLGAPGLAVDLPVTTAVILRSVAEIARSYGEDIGSEEGKRACLEVFALGGSGGEDDEAEVGYWGARAALGLLATDAALRQIARSFGVALSEKFLAQSVPAIGAVAGGGLNYVFIDYYQQMARVHFTLRQMERRTGDPSMVRACFDSLVQQLRAQRGPGRRAPRSASPAVSVSPVRR